MTDQQFQTGVVITGDSSGAVRAVNAVGQSLSQTVDKTIENEKALRTYKAALDEATGSLRSLIARGLEYAGTALAVRAVVDATIEHQTALAKLDNALRGVNDSFALTRAQLLGLGEELQKTTTFSADQTVAAEALLLTYRHISSDVFPQVVKTAANVAAALGTDLLSATRLLGNALEYPAQGITALSREGLRFSDDAKLVIKALADQGNTAQAQGLILDALSARYSGTAEAARNTLGGALAALKNQFADLLVGGSAQTDELTQSVERLTKTLSDPYVAQGFRDFSAAVITAFNALAQYGAQAVESIRNAAEWLARISVGSADPVQRIQDKIDALRRQQQYGATPGLLPLFAAAYALGIMPRFGAANAEQNAQIEAQIAELEKQKRSLQELLTPLQSVSEATERNSASTKDYDARIAALRDSLGLLTPEQKKYADALQAALDMADPAGAQIRKYQENLALIEAAYRSGRVSLAQLTQAQQFYNQQIANARLDDFARQAQQALSRGDDAARLFSAELALLFSHLDAGQGSVAGFQRQLDQLVFGEQGTDKALAELQQRLAQLYETFNAPTNASSGFSFYGPEQYRADVERATALYQLAIGNGKDMAEQVQKDYTTALDNIKSSIDDMSSAWGKAANSFIDGFKLVLDYQARITANEQQLGQLRATLALQQQAHDAGALATQQKINQLTEQQMQLLAEQPQIALRSLGQLSSAASGFFGQQTAAYKALRAASDVFHATEIAQEIALQGPKAVNALLSSLQEPFPLSLVGFAAIAAIVASLGVAVRGGSSGAPSAIDTSAYQQQHAGTGTILGNATAQSQSIANDIQHLREYANQGLTYSQAMLVQLTQINAGINGAASLFYRSALLGEGGNLGFSAGTSLNFQLSQTFDPIAQVLRAVLPGAAGFLNRAISSISSFLFGSSKTSITDTGLSLGSDTTVQTALNDQLQAYYYAAVRTQTKGPLGGLFGGNSDTTTLHFQPVSDELNQQITRIIEGLDKTIVEAVTALGGDAQAAQETLSSLKLNLDRISLQGLKPDELEKQIQAVFSALGDRMASAIASNIGGVDITKFEQAGEGMLQTLVRVASDYEFAAQAAQQLHLPMVQLTQSMQDSADIASDLLKAAVDANETTLQLVGTVKVLGNTQPIYQQVESGLAQMVDAFSGTAQELVTFIGTLYQLRDAMNAIGTDGQQLNQVIVTAAGGLDALKSGLQTYFQDFLSADQQIAAEQAHLSTILGRLGLQLPATRAGFEALIQGLDLTTEAGQQAYGTLIAAADDFNQYYSALEQQQQQAAQAAQQAAQAALDAQKKTQQDLQQQYDTLVSNFNAAVQAAADTLQKLTDSIQQAQAGIADAILGIRRQMDGWNEAAYQSGLIDQLRGRLGSGSISDQISTVNSLKDAIVARYNAEYQQIQSLKQAAQQSYQTQLSAAQALQSALVSLKSFAQGLLTDSSLTALTPTQQLAAARRAYEDALHGIGSDPATIQALQSAAQSYLTQAHSYYASSADYTSIFNQVQKQVSGIAGMQVYTPSAPYTGIYDRQIAQLQAQSVQELEGLDATLEKLQHEASAQYAQSIQHLQDQLVIDTKSITDAIKAAGDATVAQLAANMQVQAQASKNSTAEIVSAIAAQTAKLAAVYTTPPIIALPSKVA
ncbi:MAG: hypothetical protein QJR02_07220 [Sinobacteraceae bacterium]|nr:hypothetical protein [Nevskiaceae bacterium]